MGLYDQLNFNNGQFVPQYAGAPLEEIDKTASELSNRHYSNLARLNQLQLLREQAKSKVLPGAKGYIESQFIDIDAALQEIAQSGGENSTAKIAAIGNRFLGDQGVLRATQTAQEYEKFLDTQRALKAQGKSPIHNKKLEQQYLNTPVTDPETGQMSSLYNDPFKLTAEPLIEAVPEIDKLWSVIKPDAMEGVLGKRDYLMLSKLIPQAIDNGAIDMPLFYEMAKRSGIDATKINKFKDAVKRQVEASDLGRQVREFETLAPQQLDDLILQRGLMRVYQDVDRTVVQSGVTDDLLRGSKAAVSPGIRTPLPAKVRQKFDPGFTTKQIDALGNAQPSFFESLFTNEGSTKSEVLRGDAKRIRDFYAKHPDSDPRAKAKGLADADYYEKQANEQDANKGKFTKEKTDKMISYMRTAMEVQGSGDVDRMTDDEVKGFAATDKGKEVLKDYLETYTEQRFHSPWINNIVDEKTRQANEDFLRGNFSQREFIDMATGEHYSGLKDENGDVRENLLELSKALQDKKAIVEGTVDPKHIYSSLAASGDNFVRGLRVQVPFGDKGEMKEFLVSQPTGATSTTDINENVIYNTATEIPGRWSSLGKDMQVVAPANEAQKKIFWNKYGPASGTMRETFMNSDIVIVKDTDGVIVFPNYTIAAEWIAQNKGKLTKQKSK